MEPEHRVEPLSALNWDAVDSGPPPQLCVKLDELREPLTAERRTEPAKYEAEVFNFLLSNKEPLGIAFL